MTDKTHSANKRFVADTHWSVAFLDVPLFAHLDALFSLSSHSEWPSVEWFNQLSDGIVLASGQKLKFVANDDLANETRYYEQIIYETGQVPTRLENWHDLFGAFIWLLFPKTKSLLNQLHINEINEFGLVERSTARNAITLFDECGVIVTYDPTDLLASQIPVLLQTHQWSDAFVTHRALWGNQINAFMFGHANYEMATKPYLGLTGKVLFLPLISEFNLLSLKKQYQELDDALCNHISDNQVLINNKQLSPMPFLGIPNWYDDNQDPQFYHNTDYFRPKRRNT
ncbi:DUF3025 domain-containing protein [Pseudoalteromonas tunicata]|uniref:Transmembrane protein n=1 Tax=Pseudoalteromonas tunicata D2 TaxID=87626 RepID=A4CCD2_9GAMM|nr:DUF3025 domain-containing protein [Pseudoalteromonas tunicata]ATC94566.1 hypothetical protein PTUN_a2025 [Pseudoalteromonas tunicata]AXT30293.1 DUF3025 domain-containing protein [Pseudoalteromonas tunicata]EAR28019.1 hypothetical protein PTD2_19395 [Pseudoalteromonas tunicata D2]